MVIAGARQGATEKVLGDEVLAARSARKVAGRNLVAEAPCISEAWTA